MVTIIVGGHFGDEGKGKIVSYLANKDDIDIVVRAGVGPNAGHTVFYKNRRYGLRVIPCGFVNERAVLLIGAGVLINPKRFLEEVNITKTKGRIFIDKRCGIIEDRHRMEDMSDTHLKRGIGTTGSGCGPANAERAYRTIKLAKDIPELKSFITDVPLEINNAIENGKRILIEASQGFGLSLFYGTYPFVTSKDTSASMAAVDVGIGPTKVKEVIVVYKAYTTRVGEGPMKSMITEENIAKFPIWQDVLKDARNKGIYGSDINDILSKYLDEWGTVTHRKRRVGIFDMELAKYSAMVNGATNICITCIDKIFPECKGVKEYDKLSKRARDYIENIEKEIGVNVILLSTGPKSDDIIDLRL
ncbi:MAG: adenylosuccinate synthetase [Candidatus Altiarchaeales archaeon]|nr:MAG: adenylosuccinate synthetase [Candidatus Altiarchaeales archaeon]